jgi:hypothetical protein
MVARSDRNNTAQTTYPVRLASAVSVVLGLQSRTTTSLEVAQSL